MARVKKTENQGAEEQFQSTSNDIMEGYDLALGDGAIEVPMKEVPKRTSTVQSVAKSQEREHGEVELVNCLRNERVIARFIEKPGMITNPKHVLYGGMSESSTRAFTVPRLNSTGLFVNVLTNSEKAFLEHIMGLDKDALSIYRKNDNFWSDANPNGIGKVILHKQDTYFDLSVPEEYIKYKILLANKNLIAKSLQEMEEHPKATYQYVLISESSTSKSNLSKMDATMECYMEFGRVRDDVDTLRTIIEIIERRPLSSRVKTDYLQGKISEYIQKDPRRFLGVIKDELLPLKVLVKRGVEAGIIGTMGNTYYMKEDNTPLHEAGEESTLTNAAKYLGSIKHQELKYKIEALLKEQ